MRKIKTTIKNWLGFNTLAQSVLELNEKLENAKSRINELHYQVEANKDLIHEAQSMCNGLENELNDIKYDLEDKATEYDIDNAIDDLRDEIPTRSDIVEMIQEEMSEDIEQVIKDLIDDNIQKDFDYDLVVSQVVSIIVEKLNN
jgi:chromosome segregation ATPase